MIERRGTSSSLVPSELPNPGAMITADLSEIHSMKKVMVKEEQLCAITVVSKGTPNLSVPSG